MSQAIQETTTQASMLDVTPALDIISKNAAEGRKNRVVPQETIDAIRDTGFFRSVLPKKYGGMEVTPQQFFKSALDIAERDMSTAWASGIIAVHAYQLAIMPPQAAEEVYASGPDTLISSSYNPVGAKVKTVDGGFELSGRWGWSSGSLHCDWVLLGGVIPDHPSGVHYRTFLVKKPDYVIEETWFPMGLHATGSNDIVIEEPVFIPEHRTHHQMDGFNCVSFQDNPMYSIPWAQMFVRVVSSPSIGAAKHALKLFIDNATTSSTDTTRLAGDPDVTRRVAECANLIDETEAIVFRNFDEMMAKVTNGEEIPMMDRVKYRYQASLVIERMMEAVDLLFNIAGGRSVYDGSPIQEIWHDIHIARAHVANNPVSFARNFGGMQLTGESSDVFV
ncbi:MAG: flavin-dependent monooxygenase [Parvibaculales bacterium]